MSAKPMTSGRLKEIRRWLEGGGYGHTSQASDLLDEVDRLLAGSPPWQYEDGGKFEHRRVPVPGGWIVETWHDDGKGQRVGELQMPNLTIVATTFVPTTPTLVRLEGDSGDPHLVNPSLVMGILSRGQSEPGSEVWCGAQGILHVKGTPDEVAAKLGLAVAP